MKISGSIRNLYDLQYDLNKNLELRVKDLFESNKQANWFYKGRIKGRESFAQKIETGRFKADALEDFFACTIVVENRNAIDEALKFVEQYCLIEYKKPKHEVRTHKSPDLFCFDDLRLYVRLKSSEMSPLTPLNDIVFEVQIKTFLQHAWSIATHDLIYKGDSISWAKARVAYQIKAMLENAEISIEQVESIAQSSALRRQDDKTQGLSDIINWLQITWERDLLPKDIVRLSQTISDVLQGVNIQFAEIRAAVEAETLLGAGANAVNLSPYEVVIKSLVSQGNKSLDRFLKAPKVYTKLKIFVTPEMEIDDVISGIQPGRIIYAATQKKAIKVIGTSKFSNVPFLGTTPGDKRNRIILRNA